MQIEPNMATGDRVITITLTQLDLVTVPLTRKETLQINVANDYGDMVEKLEALTLIARKLTRDFQTKQDEGEK